MESLKLITSKKELLIYSFVFFTIFLFNLINEYFNYKDFTNDEVYENKFQIENIYEKETYQVLKLRNSDFTFFTSIDKNHSFKKLDYINIAVLSNKLDFLSYLKGFYTKAIYYEQSFKKDEFKTKIYKKIVDSHENIKLQELFTALFLAVPISKENRQIYTDLGISHLIAISGFHLGILSFLSFWFIYFPYSYLHKKYFVYRNKKFDVLVFTMFILFFYLYLTNFVPSLLRSFVMFCLAVYFLRRNYDIFSFQSLLITFLFIIAFFPKYLFSISLWFSIIGVFYIFLYLHYFKKLPKLFSFFFFNFWIFFVFNPIVHLFFPNTVYEQLLSPFITLAFTIFYPLELFFHFIEKGDILDKTLLALLSYEVQTYSFYTNFYFFVFYVLLSLSSIFYKYSFIFLNVFLILFNILLYF